MLNSDDFASNVSPGQDLASTMGPDPGAVGAEDTMSRGIRLAYRKVVYS